MVIISNCPRIASSKLEGVETGKEYNEYSSLDSCELKFSSYYVLYQLLARFALILTWHNDIIVDGHLKLLHLASIFGVHESFKINQNKGGDMEEHKIGC